MALTLAMNLEHKYTVIEYERRFLVLPNVDWKSDVESYSKHFEDKYLHGTRLRLRILTDSDTDRRVIKLNKKTETDSPYCTIVSRILLTQAEYELLDKLDGARIAKTRYYHSHLERVFSIDVFEDELEGLILCETEAQGLDELMSVKFPPFARHEVTEDPFFTGGNLCRMNREEVTRKLSTFA